MGRLSASLLALLLSATVTVVLTSCGSSNSGLLPGGTASEINSNLDQVQQLVAEGDCAGAEEASTEVSNQVEGLGGVNARLKEALSEGAARLADVVSTCEEVPNEQEEAEEAALREAEGEAEAEEEAEKKERAEKPGKSEKDKEKEKEQKPPDEPPEPPAEEKSEETPPAEEGGNSGGVGPGAPATEGE